ncbi:hypothetical protein KS08_19500 [Bacillus subtilis]|nr:hypothetical protein KS08_19500 [Bacillus subtilis]
MSLKENIKVSINNYSCIECSSGIQITKQHLSIKLKVLLFFSLKLAAEIISFGTAKFRGLSRICFKAIIACDNAAISRPLKTICFIHLISAPLALVLIVSKRRYAVLSYKV